jgi:fructose-bisphosphate aldolase, class I
VLIKSPEKAKAEQLLLEELLKGADALPAGQQVMVKVTIPEVPDLYAPLIAHNGIQRVVALSGGYTRDDACARLSKNHNMIASFSRALVDGLNVKMSDAEFNTALGEAIDAIYKASTVKT